MWIFSCLKSYCVRQQDNCTNSSRFKNIEQTIGNSRYFKINYFFIFSALEQEQQNYLNLVETIAQDLTPLGKLQSEQTNEDSDAESAAGTDDQESSASEADDHESEDDNDGRESFTVNY